MISNSRDILNLSIAVALIAIAVFLCWAIYYLIVSLKRINKLGQQIESGVNKIDDLLELAKSRLKKSSSYLFLASKLAERAIDYFAFKKKRFGGEEEEEEEENERGQEILVKTKVRKKRKI